MIKLIASDLDGTLLTDSKELSQTTVQILDMAVKKGIYVIPATGRSFRAIPERIRNYPVCDHIQWRRHLFWPGE